jgi:hypothetical protein
MQELLLAGTFGVLLSVAALGVHYFALVIISKTVPQRRLNGRWLMLIVFSALFVAHLVEVSLFAFAYRFLHTFSALGGFSAEFHPTLLNYYYFSMVSFTTMGLSGFSAVGPMKLISAVESLIGFLLITWLASFGYRSMGHFWEDR